MPVYWEFSAVAAVLSTTGGSQAIQDFPVSGLFYLSLRLGAILNGTHG